MLRPLEFGLPGLLFDGSALLNLSGVAGKNAVGWTDQIPGFHPGLIQTSPPPGVQFPRHCVYPYTVRSLRNSFEASFPKPYRRVTS